MSTGYKIDTNDSAYFLTFQIVGWVDLFSRKVYRDIVIDYFKYCQKNKGLDLFAYIIMSNHIHLLARSQKGDLSENCSGPPTVEKRLLYEFFRP